MDVGLPPDIVCNGSPPLWEMFGGDNNAMGAVALKLMSIVTKT